MKRLTILPPTPYSLDLPGIPGDRVGIVFVHFGMNISPRDTRLTFGEARQDIIDEMNDFPRRPYVLGNRNWQIGSAQLTMLPGPELTHGDLLLLLAGATLFFGHAEFVEADMHFRRLGNDAENLMLLGFATLRTI